MLILLVFIVVPFYLLLNQYWKSLIVLVAAYGALGFAFLRLGRYMRRVMRRAPADIPPWQGSLRGMPAALQPATQFGAAEAIQNAYKDPHYLQDVLKPRLRQLLVYRVSGGLNPSLEALDALQWAHIEPAISDFLQRHEATSLWARYRRRRQRLQEIRTVLRYLETL
jgi:hypothetical protein